MAGFEPTDFHRHMARRKWQGRAFHLLCLLAILVGLSMLGALLYNIIVNLVVRRINYAPRTAL